MLRTLCFLIWAFSASLSCTAAEMERLPPGVEDPFGLGPRLALISYLQEHGAAVPAGATFAEAFVLFKQLQMKTDTIPEEEALTADRIRRLRRTLLEDHGIETSEDVTEDDLRILLTDRRVKNEITESQRITELNKAEQRPSTEIVIRAPAPAQDPRGMPDTAVDPSANDTVFTRGAWPPVDGHPLPKRNLISADGNSVDLAGFLGKPLILFAIGTPCPGCNALAGGNRAGVGGYQSVTPQVDCSSIDEWLRNAGHVEPTDNRFHIVHLLLVNNRGVPPSVPEAKEWQRHFGLVGRANHQVLIGEASMGVSGIPGLFLFDASGKLVAHTASPTFRDNLQTVFMPRLESLLK